MTETRKKLPQFLLDLCRDFRQHPTDTETTLWTCLRDRRLYGYKFRRQHAIGRYVVDFYCHEQKLCVEIDGGIHWQEDKRSRDISRQKYLEDQGYVVVRVNTEDVRKTWKVY